MRKVSAFLLLLVLLVSFTCSFLAFPILPVNATTETRYLTNTVVDTAYNLSLTQTGTKVDISLGISAEEESIKIYCGIKVYVLTSAYASTLISGTTPIAIVSQELLSTTNWANSTTWVHAANATAGKAVKIEVYGDINNPPTTLRATFKTENMTEFLGISSNTWTVYYTGRAVYSGATTKTTAYFSFGITANYNARIEGFEVSYAAPATLTYANVSAFRTSDSLAYIFGGQTASFVTNWTASGTLDRFVLSTNSSGSWTNETAVSFGANTWSNTTKTVNTTGDIQLGWRIYANDTAGTSNVTSIQTLYVWKYVPPPSDHILGQSAGFSWTGGIYYKGAHDVIYVSYLNSSAALWYYYVAAYDVNETKWYVQATTLFAGDEDTHYNPAISVLPDGRLIMFVGYFGYLQWTISTNDADTETDTSKLISEWGAVHIDDTLTEVFSYPMPCHFSDRLVVFGREGASHGGNVTQLIWKANITRSHYVSSLNSSYLDWSEVGTTPYLGNNSDYIWVLGSTVAGVDEGWFGFATFPTNIVDSMQSVNLIVTSDMAATSTVNVTLLSAGTWYNYTLTSGTATTTIDVSSILTTSSLISNAKLLFTTNYTAATTSKVITARFDVNYTGWASSNIIFLPAAGFNSTYWHFTYNSTGTILGAGYGYDSTTGYSKNIYGMYSNDKGDTWCRMNETTPQTLPYNLTGALLYTTNQYSRCAAPSWDENGKIIISYHMYEGIYDQLSEQFKVGICSYNSTLGSATGVWSIANATDATYGTELTGYSDIGQPLFLDSWYGRPTIWLAPDTLIKYVRVPNSTSQFLAVSNDTSVQGVALQAANIQESQGYYSIFSQEAYTKTLGNKTVGANQVALNNSIFYGTRFTATANGTLDWGMIWANMSSYDKYWQMAVYHAGNLSLLAKTAQGYLTSGSTAYGWGMRLSFPATPNPKIYEGNDYWVCFRSDALLEIVKGVYSEDASNVNYTLYQTYAWASEFPSTLAPSGYKNWTFTTFAAPSFLRVRGLGVMEFSDTGTNTTARNVTCQFRTYVKNDNGLSFSYFHSNNTGSWLNTTYATTLSGTARYIYFNVTTNDTTCVVLWEIWVNDSNNNWGHTPTQTLALSGGPISSLGSVGLAFSVNALKSLSALFMRVSPFNFAVDKLNSFGWVKPGNALLSFGVWFLNLFSNPFTSGAGLSFSTVGGQGFQPSKIGHVLAVLGSDSERAYAVVGSYVSDLAFSSSGVKGLSNPFAGSGMLSFVTAGYVAIAHAVSFVRSAVMGFVSNVANSFSGLFGKSAMFSFETNVLKSYSFGRMSEATFSFSANSLFGRGLTIIQSALLSFSSNIMDSFSNLFQNSAPLSSGSNGLLSIAFGRTNTANLGFSTTSTISLSIAQFLSLVQSAILNFSTALNAAWTSSISSSGVFSFASLEGLGFNVNKLSNAPLIFDVHGSFSTTNIISIVQSAVLGFTTALSQAWSNIVNNAGGFNFNWLQGLGFSFGRVSTATFNFNTYGSILTSLITAWTLNGQAVLSFVTGMLPSRLALPLGSSFGIGADETYEILFGFSFVMLVVVVGYGLSRREHEND